MPGDFEGTEYDTHPERTRAIWRKCRWCGDIEATWLHEACAETMAKVRADSFRDALIDTQRLVAEVRAERDRLRAALVECAVVARRKLWASTTEKLVVAIVDRALGGADRPWRDHPEATCQQCGGPSVVWHAPNAVWNAVMGSPNGIVCPICFVRAAEARGIGSGLWELHPDPAFDDKGLPRTCGVSGVVLDTEEDALSRLQERHGMAKTEDSNEEWLRPTARGDWSIVDARAVLPARLPSS